MFELEPEQFKAIVDRFAYFASIMPALHEAVKRKYPDGTYERIAFEKLVLIVPKLEHIRMRFTEERGSITFSPEERALVKELVIAFQDAKAILGETDFDVSMPP